MGVETTAPRVNDETLAANFTNEGGVGGTIRLLKNIMGLWLVQECRRAWEREGKAYSYDELTRLAEAAPAFGAWSTPTTTRSSCRPTCRRRWRTTASGRASRPRTTAGATVRCALERLALCYRWVLERLERADGETAANDPHRRRRQPEWAAQPVHGRRLRSPGAGRPGGGDGDRQRADAGRRPGRAGVAGRRAARWCGGRSRCGPTSRKTRTPGAGRMNDFRRWWAGRNRDAAASFPQSPSTAKGTSPQLARRISTRRRRGLHAEAHSSRSRARTISAASRSS